MKGKNPEIIFNYQQKNARLKLSWAFYFLILTFYFSHISRSSSSLILYPSSFPLPSLQHIIGDLIEAQADDLAG